MQSPTRPYKRSIWRHDERYGIEYGRLGASDFETIARLASVDAAKKQIPPIPARQLLDISRLAKGMPPTADVTADQIAQFLLSGKDFHGAGVATLICMLSVESEGAYAPMDRKVAAGLKALGKITQMEQEQLTGGHIRDFASVYASKVIPYWAELRQSLSAEDADNMLGAAGTQSA